MRDYRKEFKDYCLTCDEYDIYSKGDSTQRGFRCKHHHRSMAFDESCSSYHFDKARGNNQIEDAVSFRVKKGYDPKPDSSYWYLVSTICKILTKEYGEVKEKQINSYLEAFKSFRDGLFNYPNGVNFLANYDINGLRLANLLLDSYEQDKEQTVRYIENELVPSLESFTNMMNYNNHPGALRFYIRIMDCLTQEYAYTAVQNPVSNKELIGSGRVRELLQSME